MKLNKFACAIAIVGLLSTVTFASPPEVSFDSTNVTGGDSINDGTVIFGDGLDLTVVEIGTFDININGVVLVEVGVYYHYPMIDLTVFSGVKTGGLLPPGGVVTANGVVVEGEIVSGSGVIVTGNSDIDGVHIYKAPETPEPSS